MRWPRADLEEKQEPRAATSASAERHAKGIWHDVTRKGLTEAAIEKRAFVKLTHDQSLGPLAGDIDGQVKSAGGVCPDGGKSGRMAFRPRADLQNQATGWLRKGCSSLGGGTVIRFL